MRFLLFGCPVAIILIVNFVFYTLTVRSIRRGLKTGKILIFNFGFYFFVFFVLVRVQVERKFQRKKQVVPGEYDVKIYMRMAVLAGFGWTIGFILFVLPEGQSGFKFYLVATFKYLFILLNATPGLFIFAVYVWNRRVFALYRQLLTQIYEFFHSTSTQVKEFLSDRSQRCLDKTRNQLEKFNSTEFKNNQEIIPMHLLSSPTMVKPSASTNQTTLTRLLTEEHNRSSKINSTYNALKSTSSEEQSNIPSESNS